MRGFAIAALAASAAIAQTPGSSPDDLTRLPSLLWEDTRVVVETPARASSDAWNAAGLGAAAVLGTALLLDRKADDAARRNGSPSRLRLAKDLAQPGGTGGLLLLGAGYAGASLLGREEARATLVDMGIATILAQVAILPLKYGLGRSRPADEEGAARFRPFSSSDGFPSGHAAQAFAMASALALHSDNPWVGWCAYGAAGLVGVSRLMTRDHHASDVVAGALVGTFMGRTVAGINGRFRARPGQLQVSLAPALAPGFQGITLQARF